MPNTPLSKAIGDVNQLGSVCVLVNQLNAAITAALAAMTNDAVITTIGFWPTVPKNNDGSFGTPDASPSQVNYFNAGTLANGSATVLNGQGLNRSVRYEDVTAAVTNLTNLQTNINAQAQAWAAWNGT